VLIGLGFGIYYFVQGWNRKKQADADRQTAQTKAIAIKQSASSRVLNREQITDLGNRIQLLEPSVSPADLSGLKTAAEGVLKLRDEALLAFNSLSQQPAMDPEKDTLTEQTYADIEHSYRSDVVAVLDDADRKSGQLERQVAQLEQLVQSSETKVQETKQTIAQAEQAVAAVATEGFAVVAAQEHLATARSKHEAAATAFNEKRFSDALQHLSDAEESADNAVTSASEEKKAKEKASKRISEAQSAVNGAAAYLAEQGFDTAALSEARTHLAAAQSDFGSGKFSEALDSAAEAKKKAKAVQSSAEETVSLRSEAVEALAQAEEAYANAETEVALPHAGSDAEEKLARAKQALEEARQTTDPADQVEAGRRARKLAHGARDAARDHRRDHEQSTRVRDYRGSAHYDGHSDTRSAFGSHSPRHETYVDNSVTIIETPVVERRDEYGYREPVRQEPSWPAEVETPSRQEDPVDVDTEVSSPSWGSTSSTEDNSDPVDVDTSVSDSTSDPSDSDT
jgi:hypothetical protein